MITGKYSPRVTARCHNVIRILRMIGRGRAELSGRRGTHNENHKIQLARFYIKANELFERRALFIKAIFSSPCVCLFLFLSDDGTLKLRHMNGSSRVADRTSSLEYRAKRHFHFSLFLFLSLPLSSRAEVGLLQFCLSVKPREFAGYANSRFRPEGGYISNVRPSRAKIYAYVSRASPP